MTEKDIRTERRDDERAEEQTERDLPVRPEEADKVKGGVVGPCDRSKQ